MVNRKGVILAGGNGTRLYPVTKSISKQILPVYDKPMIFYPLTTLMLAGIRDILIITTRRDLPLFCDLLGDGEQWGISLNYEIQDHPGGIAQAFTLGRDFINNSPTALILGDNLFYGHDLVKKLKKANDLKSGALIFGYQVSDPERYGVMSLDKKNKIIDIEEKPSIPKSNYAVTGLYFYDNKVCDFAQNIVPSKRGELEITDINLEYLKINELHGEILGRGFAWLDTGTFKSLHDASLYISSIQDRQGTMIACPEEVAFNNRWIGKDEVEKLAFSLNNYYGDYLLKVINQ